MGEILQTLDHESDDWVRRRVLTAGHDAAHREPQRSGHAVGRHIR